MPNNDAEREIIDGLLQDAEGAIAAGSLPKAAAIYRGILAIDPEDSVALRQLGTLAVEFGDYDAAIDLLRQAVAQEPTNPDLYHGIGTALRLQNRGEDALMAWQGALRVDPTYAPALHDTGLLLQQRGDLERASEMFRRLALAHANHFEAVFNRAIVLYRQDNLLAAERWFHQAARLNPRDARPMVNLAMIYRVFGIPERAIACLEAAIALDPEMPDAHWNLANARLVTGDFARGFAEYEWRFRRPGFAERPFALPRWRGEDPRGKTILVTAEQGLGDLIHFARFAAPLADRGARVVVECQAGLERLIATAPGVAAVTKWGTAPPDVDYVIPLMSVPHILGTTLETIPGAQGYLRVPDGTAAPTLSEPGFKVGIAWRGNAQHANDKHRSLSLDVLAPLREVTGVHWYSLQIGDGLSEVPGSPWQGQLRLLTPHIADFAATAAVIQQLDLVISVDTSIAHLAGALGKPVWTLLSRGNDWRWLEHRTDTPWYASMRLFRQHPPRNWTPTLRAMSAALAEAVARGHA